MEDSNLKVAVRIRPLNAQERSSSNISKAVQVLGNEIIVSTNMTGDPSAGVSHSFNFDSIFNSSDSELYEYANQEKVFISAAQPLIDSVFQGYNACLFAYGQTGSGKSYSMMGFESLDQNVSYGVPHSEAGIIPRFCRELFKRLNAAKHIQADVEISYFEIYNEKIHDLLSVTPVEKNMPSGSLCAVQSTSKTLKSNLPPLKVREHPIWGPYVVDLTIHPVNSYEALRNCLSVGDLHRATAATGMNGKSSRSHSIFNIVLNFNISNSYESNAITQQTLRSRISLVDLAGSERIASVSNNGDRIREGVSINKSLLTLGKVIAALAETKKNNASASTFVPYRESVLTWLLRENLGGNSKTVMLATISPANIHVEDTLSTLRYACQARSIVNRIKVNESPHDKIIRELRTEVTRLKLLQNEYERQRWLSDKINTVPRKIIIGTEDENDVDGLKKKLAECEKELDRAQKSRIDGLKESERQRRSEMQLLRRKGLALELTTNQKHACLVNLTADPILSGTLFYILPPGQVKIGRTRISAYCNQPDIVLDGLLVAYNHCVIENIDNQLFVIPENKDFETYVNGEMINSRQKIFHGDRLVIGGTHFFRISNPYCLKRSNNVIVDFQMAHEEILQKQEKALRFELEEEKRVTLSKIEFERVENEKLFSEKMQKLELEHFKYKCKREILEAERKALKEEPNKNKHIMITQAPSFQSRILENIKYIIQNPSEESLYKTQLMVKEATQICRNFGLKLEFRQSQEIDEFGIYHTVILLSDIENSCKAEWPIARLGVWLDIVRNNKGLNKEDIFKSVDTSWKPLESAESGSINNSFNDSRIALNLNIVQKARTRNSSTHQSLIENLSNTNIATVRVNAKCEESLKEDGNKKNEDENTNIATMTLSHIHDMQRSALHLKLLFSEMIAKQGNEANYITTNADKTHNLFEKLNNTLQELRNELETNIFNNLNEISLN